MEEGKDCFEKVITYASQGKKKVTYMWSLRHGVINLDLQ